MTAKPSPDPGAELYISAEVAALLHVGMKTLARWDREGRLPPGTVTRTPGNHRRWNGDWVRSLLAGAR